MKGLWSGLPRAGRRLVVSFSAVATLATGAIVYASRFDAAEAGAWFAAIQAAVSVVALIAAALAVAYALPGFIEWERQQGLKPRIGLSFQIEGGGGVGWIPATDGTPAPPSHFHLSVLVANDGDAPLRDGLLNIVVPAECRIIVADPPEKRHYVFPRTSRNPYVYPGRDAEVAWSVAERAFTPGHHLYTVLLQPRGDLTTLPVIAEVTGDGLEAPIRERIELNLR